MREFKFRRRIHPYKTGTITIEDVKNGNFIACISLTDLNYFCGGKWIYNMEVRSDLTEEERKVVLGMLFGELKKIQVAKLLWADVVKGCIHRSVTEVYPDSEVGSIQHNPNSGNNIICGELNIEDM